MIETSLAPGILLAMPHLLDPNFGRSVVLMVEHNDEGSFGLVVNQPSALPARELLESLDIPWRGDAGAVVWRGGPVMPGFGWILHDPLPHLMAQPATGAQEEEPEAGWKATAPGADTAAHILESDGTVLLWPELALTYGSMKRLRDIAAAPPPHVRVVLGYAGWGPGQLAQEMARGSWLHANPSMELLFDTPPEEMWERALRSLGIGPESIVPSVGVH